MHQLEWNIVILWGLLIVGRLLYALHEAVGYEATTLAERYRAWRKQHNRRVLAAREAKEKAQSIFTPKTCPNCSHDITNA